MSKMEGLPPTSDIKMIDIWLILASWFPLPKLCYSPRWSISGMKNRKKTGRWRKSSQSSRSRSFFACPPTSPPKCGLLAPAKKWRVSIKSEPPRGRTCASSSSCLFLGEVPQQEFVEMEGLELAEIVMKQLFQSNSGPWNISQRQGGVKSLPNLTIIYISSSREIKHRNVLRVSQWGLIYIILRLNFELKTW